MPDVLFGRSVMPPFDTADLVADRDWEMRWAIGRSPADLHHLFDEAVARSDALLDEALASPAGLDLLAVRTMDDTGQQISLRWILLHLIEEYARHNGHADLIRESIDGAVGE